MTASLTAASQRPTITASRSVGRNRKQVRYDPLPEADGPAWQWAAPAGLVYDAAFTPDGQTLAAVDDRGLVHLLDPLTGRVRHAFDWQVGPLYSIAFAPDGMVAAAGTTVGRAILWDGDR